MCLCVSHVGIVSKWLNVGSRKQRHVIAQGLEFSDASQKSLVDDPFPREICAQSDPPPFKNHNCDQYLLIAP